jgi:hypothetical protein
LLVSSLELVRQCCAVEGNKLVFHHVGGRYFLYQVWTAAIPPDASSPKGCAEVRMRNQDKPELVIVAARISR